MEIVPEEFKDLRILEDKIFDANDENIEDIIKYIKSIKQIKNSIFNLIFQASYTRILSFKALSEIWKSLGQPPQKVSINPFTTYLSYKGIYKFNQSILRIEDENISKAFEDVFPKNSIGYAIVHDDLDSVAYFSADDATVSKLMTSFPGKDQLQFSVLSLSAFCGAVKVFKYFYVNSQVVDDDTVKKAVMGGSVEIVEILSRTHSMKEYLNIAVQYHRNSLVSWMVDNFKVNSIPASICIDYCNTFAFFYLKSKDLLRFDESPQVFLKNSIQCERFEYIKYFLENGADINPDDEMNPICPPLITAILQHSPIVVKYLLFKGANKEVIWVNHTPLLFASQYRNSTIVSLLIEAGADVNSKGDLGLTPLIQAVSYGHLTNAKLLINAGANVNETDKYHSTALHIALENKYLKTASLLIDSGADPNAKNIYGNTPLHIAVSKDLVEETKLLLSKGARTTIKNESGETPKQLAISQEVLDLFDE